MTRNLDAKRRLLFLKGEDFNFIAFNALVLLESLGCDREDRSFRDYRKISFLVDFLSTPRLVELLLSSKSGTPVGPSDHAELARAYGNGCARLPLMSRLMHALGNRGILGISAARMPGTADVFIADSTPVAELLADPLFEPERIAVNSIRRCVRHVRTMSLNTLVDRIFRANGVPTWLD